MQVLKKAPNLYWFTRKNYVSSCKWYNSWSGRSRSA